MSACDLLKRPLKNEAWLEARKAGHSNDCIEGRVGAACPIRAWEQYPDTPMPTPSGKPKEIDVGVLEAEGADLLLATSGAAQSAYHGARQVMSRMGAEVRRLREENRGLKDELDTERRMRLAEGAYAQGLADQCRQFVLQEEGLREENERLKRELESVRRSEREEYALCNETRAANERLKARVAELVKVGTGEVQHDDTGVCPNEDVTGFQARAEGCEACRILGPAEGGR
jgi:hypothetical protein